MMGRRRRRNHYFFQSTVSIVVDGHNAVEFYIHCQRSMVNTFSYDAAFEKLGHGLCHTGEKPITVFKFIQALTIPHSYTHVYHLGRSSRAIFLIAKNETGKNSSLWIARIKLPKYEKYRAAIRQLVQVVIADGDYL